jgi:uncharacterized protein YcnI
MQPRPRTLLAPLAAAAVVALLALTGGPAGAHVEPDVASVPAGSTSTVQFTVEHGCDGSPTVKVEVRVPDQVTDADAVDLPGWTGAVVDGVVTYTGGSLPDAEEGQFGIRFTAPNEPGAVLTFPFIQTCEQGTLDWIEADEEDEHPAPTVVVGDPDPTATPPPGTTLEEPDDDADSSTTLIAILVVVVLAAGGGALWYARRSRDGGPAGPDDAAGPTDAGPPVG